MQFTKDVSLHYFPDIVKDPKRYQQWVRFVRRHRPKLEPSKYSSLRSVHFEERCYSTRRDVAIELGIRAKLNNDAIPTIDAAKQITTQLYNNYPRTQTGIQVIIKYYIKVNCARMLVLIFLYAVDYAMCISDKIKRCKACTHIFFGLIPVSTVNGTRGMYFYQS